MLHDIWPHLNETRTERERLRALLPSMFADLNGDKECEYTISPSFVVAVIVLSFLATAVIGAFVSLK